VDLSISSIVTIILALLLVAFVISMLIDIVQSQALNTISKCLWGSIIIIMPAAAVIYYSTKYHGKFSPPGTQR
jgi:uncharacterized membrane protein